MDANKTETVKDETPVKDADGVYKTSIFPNNKVEHVNQDSFKLPTWGALTLLIVAAVILKLFIYLKDEKRHDK